MKILPVLAVVPVLAATSIAQAQIGANFCNQGLNADGYIDFADMPAPPNFPASSGSAPFTATLPIHGVPGLTVQVTIPVLSNISGIVVPIYKVAPGAIQFNGRSTIGLELKFNKPVQGVGVSDSYPGRSTSFSLSTDSLDGNVALFRQDISNITEYVSNSAFPLQMVDRTGTFQTAYVSFPTESTYGSGIISNLRVQSANADTNAEARLPKTGLQMWLRSEDIVSYPGPALWPDRSGAGHDATPQGASAGIQSFGSACRSTYPFGGAFYGPPGEVDRFSFHLPINGWREMTVFLVAAAAANTNNYASDNAAIFWTENAFWGNTFVSPYQTHATFRFGTTQVGNQPVYTRSVDVGDDLTITRAVHNQTTDSLYVDGRLVCNQGGKYASLNGTTGAGFLGVGLDGTPFQGEISEVLVYNRVLTESESTAVEQYLRAKFRTR